jgi:hypothetical protein
MNRNNISPKNVVRAEEDLQVAKLRHENNRTLSTQLALHKAEKTLERLYKQVNPHALAAHRQVQAKMAGLAE